MNTSVIAVYVAATCASTGLPVVVRAVASAYLNETTIRLHMESMMTTMQLTSNRLSPRMNMHSEAALPIGRAKTIAYADNGDVLFRMSYMSEFLSMDPLLSRLQLLLTKLPMLLLTELLLFI